VSEYAKHMERSIKPEHFKKGSQIKITYATKDLVDSVKQALDDASQRGNTKLTPPGCSKRSAFLPCFFSSWLMYDEQGIKYCCDKNIIPVKFALQSLESNTCEEGKGKRGENLKDDADGKDYACDKGTYFKNYMDSLLASSLQQQQAPTSSTTSAVVEGDSSTTTEEVENVAA